MLKPDAKGAPQKRSRRGVIALAACMLAAALIALATWTTSERRKAGDEGVAQPGRVRVAGGAVVALSATPVETRVEDHSYPSECAGFDEAAQHYLAKLSGAERAKEAQRTSLASAMFHDAAVAAPNVHARTGLVNSCNQAKASLLARSGQQAGAR